MFDVALEQSGFFEDSTYIRDLPKDHFIDREENVFAYSLGVALWTCSNFFR
jgi:hypothetical protein